MKVYVLTRVVNNDFMLNSGAFSTEEKARGFTEKMEAVKNPLFSVVHHITEMEVDALLKE